jgi:hypothetical protein
MTDSKLIRCGAILTGVLVAGGWPLVVGRPLRDHLSVPVILVLWSVTVTIGLFALMREIREELRSRRIDDDRTTPNGGRLLTTEIYQRQLAVADRDLKRRWALPLLLFLVSVCASVISTWWLHLLPQSVGQVAFFVLLAIGGVGTWLAVRDHFNTAQRLGLVCPNCRATLFATAGPMAMVAHTKRCGECKAVVLAD